jgi:hypothetical protein
MARGPQAGGVQRRLEVPAERIDRWLRGFAERHGGLAAVRLDSDLVRFRAGDGALAACRVPFPPLDLALDPAADEGPEGAVAALARHACLDRRVGVLLARLGGYAAGVFDGPRLIASKVGSRPVHGRSAAGGQSQARFARRRDNQARQALRAAADTAARVLTPYAPAAPEGHAVPAGAAGTAGAAGGGSPARGHGGPLEALICGGDRRAIEALRRDRRLAAVFALETGPFLAVPDPRRAVLEDTPRLFRAVLIDLEEPGRPDSDPG